MDELASPSAPQQPQEGRTPLGKRRAIASAPRLVGSPKQRQAAAEAPRPLSGQAAHTPPTGALTRLPARGHPARQPAMQPSAPQASAPQQPGGLSPRQLAAAVLFAAAPAYVPSPGSADPNSPPPAPTPADRSFGFLAAARAVARVGGSPEIAAAAEAAAAKTPAQLSATAPQAAGTAAGNTSLSAALAADPSSAAAPRGTKRAATPRAPSQSPKRRPSSSSVENASPGSPDYEPFEPARRSKRSRPSSATEPAVRASKRLAEARSLDDLGIPLGSISDPLDPGGSLLLPCV